MLLGLLAALEPPLHSGASGMPDAPPWLSVPVGVAATWAGFLGVVAVLRWWMRRGGRWDGQGSLFNLVAASWLLVNGLGWGLIALTVPRWLYALWIAAHALRNALPRAGRGYAVAGVLVSLVPLALAWMAALGMLDLALDAMGVPR